MSATTSARFRAASVALAPAVLLAGFISHPYIGMGPPDPAAVAAAVVSDTTRWGLAHLTVSVGSGLAVLAFLARRILTIPFQRWRERGIVLVALRRLLLLELRLRTHVRSKWQRRFRMLVTIGLRFFRLRYLASRFGHRIPHLSKAM